MQRKGFHCIFQNFKYQFSQKTKKIDYYQILNLTKSASKADIKSSFHKMAKIHHPDKSQQNSDKFKEILDAYKTLTDDNLRRNYDNELNNERFSENDFHSQKTGYQSSGQNSSDYIKPKRSYRYKKNNENIDDNYDSSLVEEGFIKTLIRAPELIIITVVLVLLLGRWLFIYWGFMTHELQKDKGSYYLDSDGNKKRKIYLKEKDLKTMKIDDIDLLEKSGIYILPLDYEEILEQYRNHKFFKPNEDFGIFNYKNSKGLNLFHTEGLAEKQAENLKAQKNL